VKTLLLGIALGLGAHTSPAIDPPSYAGNWTLDQAQSRNLPSYYANVKAHRLAITQDAAHLNVGVEIENTMAPEPMHMDLPYPLDGSESTIQTTMRMGPQPVQVPTTLKANIDDAGAVHITIKRQIPTPSGTVNAQMQEEWHLGADGKTLDIHMIDDGPMGHRESDYVFVRS
jgi:hypothetical protein